MTWAVYGLIDPREAVVFYVGSSSALFNRVPAHQSDSASPAWPRCVEIKEAGLKVEHCIFGEFDDKTAARTLEGQLILLLPNVCNAKTRAGIPMSRFANPGWQYSNLKIPYKVPEWYPPEVLPEDHADAPVAADEKAEVGLELIYAVRRASDGAIKIGHTRQLQYRMEALRYDNGNCEVAYALPVLASEAMAIEEAAHALAVDYWVGGEWFRFSVPSQTGAEIIRTAALKIRSGETVDCSGIRRKRAQAAHAKGVATKRAWREWCHKEAGRC